MKIHLPNSAFLGNIDPFLHSFIPDNPNTLEITANKKWISIHPLVLAMVAGLGLKTRSKKQIKFESLEAKSIHYLERMGLFKLLGIDSEINIVEHEPAGRFIPLTQVNNSKDLSNFIVDMIPLLHLDPNQSEPIKYTISELVRNVLEHSDAKYGAIVCAQYYKKSNTIRIGIVDTGIGIKKAIAISHKVASDSDALKLALTPGITGTTSRAGGTEFNAGAGLFFIKSMAKFSRDFFVIYSENAMYKLLKPEANSKRPRLYIDPYKDRHSIGDNFPCWQGTAVGIDISLTQREDFSELLDYLRDIYAKAVREQKKIHFKKARFI